MGSSRTVCVQIFELQSQDINPMKNLLLGVSISPSNEGRLGYQALIQTFHKGGGGGGCHDRVAASTKLY